MLHAYAVRFDVTENLEKFCELNKASIHAFLLVQDWRSYAQGQMRTHADHRRCQDVRPPWHYINDGAGRLQLPG